MNTWICLHLVLWSMSRDNEIYGLSLHLVQPPHGWQNTSDEWHNTNIGLEQKCLLDTHKSCLLWSCRGPGYPPSCLHTPECLAYETTHKKGQEMSLPGGLRCTSKCSHIDHANDLLLYFLWSQCVDYGSLPNNDFKCLTFGCCSFKISHHLLFCSEYIFQHGWTPPENIPQDKVDTHYRRRNNSSPADIVVE